MTYIRLVIICYVIDKGVIENCHCQLIVQSERWKVTNFVCRDHFVIDSTFINVIPYQHIFSTLINSKIYLIITSELGVRHPFPSLQYNFKCMCSVFSFLYCSFPSVSLFIIYMYVQGSGTSSLLKIIYLIFILIIVYLIYFQLGWSAYHI